MRQEGPAPGRAYLDHAAGAPLHPAARQAAERAFALGAGNPASVHAEGRAARALVEEARQQVASLVGCEPREIVFTGSATEANAAVILGVARQALAAGQKPRLFVGAGEHPSILQAAARAGIEGAQVATLPLDERGVARVDAIEGPAALVALQLANNETGVVQPVLQAAAAARGAGALFHCDAVQAAGKLDLHDLWPRCDSLALSAHKLGGLPGVGALAIRRGHELPALVPGHQERGFRGGTPPLHAIAAFGAVARLARDEREERAARLAERTAALEAIVCEAAPDARIHGAGATRVPGIVNVHVPGIDGETLLVALDLAGISCSHGAACATGAMEPSHVLLAMGLSAREARGSLRFSVGPDTTDEEFAHLRQVLPGALQSARVGS